MKILKANPDNLRESEKVVDEVVKVIRAGGVVICPTDTVYGLVADATDKKAVTRLFKIKKRPEEKSVPIMIADLEWAKKLAFFDKKTEKVLLEIWPGAVTVILQQKYKLPELITAGKKTIALRIPNYKFTHYLLQKAGLPLTGTSANISGQPPSNKISEVLKQFKNEICRPDLALDAGDLTSSEPSTILDLSAVEPKITRVGPVSKEELFKILNLEK